MNKSVLAFLTIFMALCLLLAKFPAPVQAVRVIKMALVVGIDDYIDPGQGDNLGSRRDAEEIAGCLKGFNWQTVMELYDQAATKDSIIKELGNIASAKPEYALFFFSVEAATTADVPEKGSLYKDEDDKEDEWICPADTNPENTGKDLSDDFFAEWVRQVPIETNLALIFNSCFSSGFLNIIDKFDVEYPDGKKATKAVRDESIVLTARGGLAGTQKPDEQTTMEQYFHAHGAFPHHLVEALGKTSKLEEAFGIVKNVMTNCASCGGRQLPCMNDNYLTEAANDKDYDLHSPFPCVGGITYPSEIHGQTNNLTSSIATVTMLIIALIIAKRRKNGLI